MAVVIKESNEGVAKMIEKNQKEKIASAGEKVCDIPGDTVGGVHVKIIPPNVFDARPGVKAEGVPPWGA